MIHIFVIMNLKLSYKNVNVISSRWSLVKHAT